MLAKLHYNMCGNKMPTISNRWFLLQILLLAQHVSGTIMPIIRSSKVLYRWLLPLVFGASVFKLSVWCVAEGYVYGLRAAARKPYTCWASNKICNKNHLLRLVGILFPHINDAARTKSHQIYIVTFNFHIFVATDRSFLYKISATHNSITPLYVLISVAVPFIEYSYLFFIWSSFLRCRLAEYCCHTMQVDCLENNVLWLFLSALGSSVTFIW
jgi:hypothetical protein